MGENNSTQGREIGYGGVLVSLYFEPCMEAEGKWGTHWSL